MAILTDASGNNLVDNNGVALTDDLPGTDNLLTVFLAGGSTLRFSSRARMRVLATIAGASTLQASTIARARLLAALPGAGSLRGLASAVTDMLVHFRHKRN